MTKIVLLCLQLLCLNIFLNIFLQGDDSDYQSVGPMAGMERQELNYAALEFLHGRHREGGFRRADGDGSDYTEIKAK